MDTRPATPYIFISYASADRNQVIPLVDVLVRAGVPVWIDREEIHGGANYGREIAEAIKGAAAFVLMASSLSLASRNVKQEIAVAWEYERPYLPLLLEPVAIPGDVKYWLTAAQWIEVLEKDEREWLPQVLTALAPLGIAPAPPPPEAIRLAGREKELTLLREKLASAKQGTGGLVLIGGEAGIGKTTLAEAVLHEAGQRGAFVLVGRCFDLAETPPYGPWVETFRRYEPIAGLPPVPAAFAQRGTVGAVSSQSALFEQIHDFFAALTTSRPAVLLLDDYHWADAASLDLLRFLARDCAALPLLVLVTYRSDELTRRHPLSALLPLLVREAGAARLDLRRLDDDAVRALVTERYGLAEADAARLAAYLQSRAEGNALFLGELLRSLEEARVLRHESDAWMVGELTQSSVPPLLRQVIDGRLARLDDESQRLLAVAAIIGHEVPLAVWATVGAVDEDVLLDVVEQGIEARLLIELPDGAQVRFAHALIRETLYEGIPGIRRRRIHRRVGEALAERSNPDPDMVAFHYQRAGDDRALPWLLRAGERAQAAYAWTTAAERFEAALALMERQGAEAAERGWLLHRLARLLRYVNVPQARAFAGEAVALAGQADDTSLATIALFLHGLLGCLAGDVARGLPALEVGADAVERLTAAERAGATARSGPESGMSRLPNAQGTVVMWRANIGRFRETRDLGERLVADAAGDEARLERLRDGLVGLGQTYATLGMPGEAAAMLAGAYDAFLREGHHALASLTSSRELRTVALPYRTTDIAGRERLADRAEAAWARASGAVPATIQPRFVRLPLLVLGGRWDEAEQLATAASTDERGERSYRAMALECLATLARLRGDGERVQWAVWEGLPAGEATEPGTVAFFSTAVTLQRVAAALALDGDDLPLAKEWLEAHDRWLAWSGAVLGQSESQALWAQYYRQAGDADKAYEHAARALVHATEPRQPLALLAAHRLLGELDTEAGRLADAEQHLSESLRLADACQAPFERALTLLVMAELQVAIGETDAAKTLIDEVKAICAPLGAKPTLVRADALSARLR